jgi:hypothetical protein
MPIAGKELQAKITRMFAAPRDLIEKGKAAMVEK